MKIAAEFRINNTASKVAAVSGRLEKTVFFAVLAFSLIFSSAIFGQHGSYALGHPSSGGIAVSGTASNSGLNGVSPFMSARKNSRSQFLYLADEITGLSGTAGTITALAFNVTQIPGSGAPMTNITISIGTTSALSLTAAMPAAGCYPVYKTISSLNITQTGWFTIDLDTDFHWNGTDNIIVEICKNDVNAVASNFKVKTTQFSTDRTRGLFTYINSNAATVAGCDMAGGANTSNNVTNISPSTNRKFRPDVKFTFACSGTPAPAGTAFETNPGTHCYGDTIRLGVQDCNNASRLEYQWEWSTSSNSTSFTAIPGATHATLDVVKGPVDMYYRRKTGCSGNSLDSGAIFIKGVNTWNGSAWSIGEPALSESVFIDGDFNLTSDKEYCSFIVNSGNVTVASGVTLTVANEIRVLAGSLTFEDSASLIQLSDTAVNTGNIIYKRNSQPVRKFDFTYWSSPVAPQTLYNFSPQTLADKYLSFNTAIQNWQSEPSSNTMIAGKGYIIRAPQTFATTGAGTVFNGTFTGIPNNGEISIAATGNSWNLIGNPYPSGIDAIGFLSDPGNSNVLDGTIYLWTHNTAPSSSIPGSNTVNYNTNDYAMYNYTGGVGGTGVAASSAGNNAEPSGFIAAGQSFMVKGLNSGTAKFKNSMRTVGNNSQFFRVASENHTAEFERHRFWLEISNHQGNFKQAMIGYVTGATNDADRGYDGVAMDGTNISLYTIADGQSFGIQGRSLPFDPSDEVALGFKAGVSGTHKISMYKTDGLFGTQHVYLHDKVLNVIHNFKHGGYEFTTAAGTFNERFVIRYSSVLPDEVKVIQPVESDLIDVIAYASNGKIHLDAGAHNLDAVTIFDLSGRQLYEDRGIASTNVTISSKQWGSQILMVHIITKNITFAKKLAN